MITKHHKFPHWKSYIMKYGEKLMNDTRNLQNIELGEHINKRGTIHFYERQFCREVEILHCDYCKNDFEWGCLWNKKRQDKKDQADMCREFMFDKGKYYKGK